MEKEHERKKVCIPVMFFFINLYFLSKMIFVKNYLKMGGQSSKRN